jgi:hypothetical protein
MAMPSSSSTSFRYGIGQWFGLDPRRLPVGEVQAIAPHRHSPAVRGSALSTPRSVDPGCATRPAASALCAGSAHRTSAKLPGQKFHSNPERILAVILEREAVRWFRRVAGQFQLSDRIVMFEAR